MRLLQEMDNPKAYFTKQSLRDAHQAGGLDLCAQSEYVESLQRNVPFAAHGERSEFWNWCFRRDKTAPEIRKKFAARYPWFVFTMTEDCLAVSGVGSVTDWMVAAMQNQSMILQQRAERGRQN